MTHTIIDTREAGPPAQPRFALDRRQALKAMAAGATALAAGCSRPAEQIVPYVDMPERVVPGEILRFASVLPLAGYGRGAIAITHQGRPTKLEGNPHHPASLGSTDIFLEAMVLGLYDPGRSQAVRSSSSPVDDWDGFSEALKAAGKRAQGKGGAGLHILTGRTTSPTLVRQMRALRTRYPKVAWHRFEPINEDRALEGSRMAFGRELVALPELQKADVIWCVGADPLGPGPQQPRLARDFAQRRTARGRRPDLSRLYVTESAFTLTGANADYRQAFGPEELYNFALAVAGRVGIGSPAPLSGAAARLADAVAADLKSHRGHALVLVGDDQPAALHALAHALNHALAAPLAYIEPVDPVTESHAASLTALAGALDAGAVETLLIVGANPVYDSALPFARLIPKAGLSAHLSIYDDETSAVCGWHLPESHPLEDWSDLRAPDGTAAIMQPMITPLFDTRNAHQLIAMVLGDAREPYDIVRETWSERGAGFGPNWRQALEQGVVPGTQSAPITPPAPKAPDLAPGPASSKRALIVKPDPSIYDGRFANNAWLQECPKPLTFEVWGNAFEIGLEDAKAMGIKDGEALRISAAGETLEGPALVRDGIAAGVVVTTRGYGRRRAGAIGNDVGVRIVALEAAAARAGGVTLEKLGHEAPLYRAHRMGELDGEADQIYPELDLVKLAATKHLQPTAEPETILGQVQKSDGYDWAMVIDASACIGCNACVIACQAENNVGVVGPAEVAMGREMHWIRIDAFDTGHGKGFQPVPCMQCEKAPCEPVCPVEASIHDTEGLNVQVYNRCIGTRFCEANCPYKVRRFNWFGYTDGQEYADLGAGLMSAHYNPDVTVRARGVMEKCTYCVQRITRARRKAEQENRRIGTHEVVTACQAACPTRAIHFGNLDDPGSSVTALRTEPRHYTLLRELGTRPRTTYLARLRNTNRDLTEEGA